MTTTVSAIAYQNFQFFGTGSYAIAYEASGYVNTTHAGTASTAGHRAQSIVPYSIALPKTWSELEDSQLQLLAMSSRFGQAWAYVKAPGSRISGAFGIRRAVCFGTATAIGTWGAAGIASGGMFGRASIAGVSQASGLSSTITLGSGVTAVSQSWAQGSPSDVHMGGATLQGHGAVAVGFQNASKFGRNHTLPIGAFVFPYGYI